MHDIISILPDSVANQIAAGEVIQRPASAVKELLENSVDAGSTSIELYVKDSGKTLLQITDNGCGMSTTDARMSFERHATSKIKSADDLHSIRTMGFRGEALASIAAIAQVELKTRRHDDETGTSVVLEGSSVVSQNPATCSAGTTIIVKNLFFNVPARRNFLKSNSVEARHIIDEFQRVALAHPEISFSLQQNGLDVYHLEAGSFRQRIVALFGSGSNDKLVPVNEETSLMKIGGFIGKPEFAKKTRGEQFFFINKRFIRDAYLNHAVLNAFEELLTRDSYPSYFLHIEIDPSRIDINIHPTKTEVKFDDDRSVYAIVRAAVKHALGQFSVSPSIDFEPEKSFEPRVATSGTVVKMPGFGAAKTVAPAEFLQAGNEPKEWRKAFEGLRNESLRESFTQSESASQQLINPDWNSELLAESSPLIFQLHKKYIISQVSSGLAVIHQQAAHYRILYEKFLRQMESKDVVAQQQLFPLTLEFSAEDFDIIRELLPDLHRLGFDLSEFGKNSFVLNGTPHDVEQGKEQQVIEQMIEQYKNNSSQVKLTGRENLARAAAKNLSMPAGKTLSPRVMKALVEELFSCAMPYQSPEGKPTLVLISDEELEEKFKV
jgi:DNA mismatch repair protein MutL